MWLLTRCDLAFNITEPVPFVLMLRPRSGAQQWVEREEYRLEIAPAGDFSIHISAKIKTADFVDEGFGAPFVEIQYLPDAVLSYLLPSRYCESECFGQMATEITAGLRPGYDQVAAIATWLRNNVSFEPGSSGIPVSAVEINTNRVGVCRDFAHLGIALCRSLSIPARMVVGYLYGLEPMDLHAWFEAYVGGRWYTFDATQAELRSGYVAVGYGRDAADVAIYNQFGPPVYPTVQSVNVERIPN